MAAGPAAPGPDFSRIRSARHERVAERLALKTRSYDLMRGATTTAIVAGDGRAMDLACTAQRLAGEGMFLLVQGRTAEVRRAHLDALAGPWAD